MTTTKIILLSTVLSTLVGCTTLKDFESMSTLTRTEFVCERDRRVNDYKKRQEAATRNISKISQLLDQGHRMVESCEVKTVSVPKKVCTETIVSSTQEKTTTCTTIEEPTVSESCRQIPIAIDAGFEERKRQELIDSLPELQSKRSAAYKSCFNKVGLMTASEAYNYYENN